jgi:hypothetical protein
MVPSPFAALKKLTGPTSPRFHSLLLCLVIFIFVIGDSYGQDGVFQLKRKRVVRLRYQSQGRLYFSRTQKSATRLRCTFLSLILAYPFQPSLFHAIPCIHSSFRATAPQNRFALQNYDVWFCFVLLILVGGRGRDSMERLASSSS